jgi:hypothetical protein
MSQIQNLGNGIGWIYAALPNGSNTIVCVEKNTIQGVHNMRQIGTTTAPIVANRSAVGTIQITAVPSAGDIASVTINSVNQIGASVAVVVGDVNQTATDLAIAINAFSPSGYVFTAEAIDDIVYVYSAPEDGALVNGLTITISVTNIGITTTTTPFSGGSNQDGVYDSNFGYQFYLDSSSFATPSTINLSTAEDVSEYFVTRGLQTGIFTESLSVSTSARLLNITRCSAFTNILTDTFSGNPQTDLAFIDTNGFVQGDVIRLSQQQAGRVVTLIDANVWGATPANIYLTDQTPFNCQDNKSIELRLQYDPTLGSIWVENGRSISQGYIAISRPDMITLINSNGVTIGQDYLIQGAGLQGGVLVQGIDEDAITQSGQLVSYVPDYQNLSGDFAGVWSPRLPNVVVGKLYAWNGAMYEALTTTTGADPSSDPNYNLIFDTDPRYVKEIDNVQYNITNNTFVKREDGRGNVVYGSTAIAFFKWGCDTCYGNIITEGSFPICNITGDFISNILSSITGNVQSLSQEMKGNTMNNVFVSLNSAGSIILNYNNIQGDAAYPTLFFINDSSLTSTSFVCNNNRISNNAGTYIYISSSEVFNSNTITGNTMSFITNGYFVSFCNINMNYTLTFDLQSAMSAVIVNPSISTYEVTIDLDVAVTGNKLQLASLPTSAGNNIRAAGIWKLYSTTGGITIDEIVRFNGTIDVIADNPWPIKLMSTVGITNSIAPTAIASASLGNIVSDLGTVSLVGRTEGSDFYVIQKDGNLYQNINSVVNL